MSFVYADGLRHVCPYDSSFSVSCKPQWVGQPVEQVLVTTFDSFSAAYYAQAFREGCILVNGIAATPNQTLRQGELIQHNFHRHELPIPFGPSQTINIVYSDPDLYVADKPSGIPVHPSGRYFINSLLSILQQQLGERDLFVLNRLDRLTSGLVLLARNVDAVRRYSNELTQGQVSKTYLARVCGEFPLTAEVCQPIACVNREKGIYAVVPEDNKGETDCTVRQPLRRPKAIKSKKGSLPPPPVSRPSSSLPAKPALTRFRRLHYNGHSSLVEALPLTGRTHQIRLHLRFLGFPIVNDPNYGGSLYKGHAVQYGNVSADSLGFRKYCGECEEGGYLPDQNWYPTGIWLHSLQYAFTLSSPPSAPSTLSPVSSSSPFASNLSSAMTSPSISPHSPPLLSSDCSFPSSSSCSSSPVSASSSPSSLPFLSVRTALPEWAAEAFDSEGYCLEFLTACDPKLNY